MDCPSCHRTNRPDARFCDGCGTSLARPTDVATARKIVTIVFADLVGSTSLHERLDAESARRLMDRYYGALRDVVDAHGGALVKLLGDGVMAAFGVPRVPHLRHLRQALEHRGRERVEVRAARQHQADAREVSRPHAPFLAQLVRRRTIARWPAAALRHYPGSETSAVASACPSPSVSRLRPGLLLAGGGRHAFLQRGARLVPELRAREGAARSRHAGQPRDRRHVLADGEAHGAAAKAAQARRETLESALARGHWSRPARRAELDLGPS